MDQAKRMLLENLAWSQERMQKDEDFFDQLASGQSPKVLWLGCADSRVPPDTITRCVPGSIFVHRNIANLFSSDDDNVMSVVEYATTVLKISDIIVCGHYGCGGVKASLFPPDDRLPHVNRRIAPLRILADSKKSVLDSIQDENERIGRLSEFNVVEQVDALRRHPLVKDASAPIAVHGRIFDLKTGRLSDLCA